MIFWMILQSCLSNTAQKSTPPEHTISLSMVGQPWVLIESIGFQQTEHKILLEFFENNTMALDCNCNDIVGKYTIDGKILNLSEIRGTEMDCRRPPFDNTQSIYDDESFLLQFLMDDPEISRNGEYLILSNTDTILTLGPERLLPPESISVPFYDTVWTIDEKSTIETPIIRLEDDSPSMVFEVNNTFTLQTGCNEARGKYTALSNSIVIELTQTTENTCSPDALSKMDAVLNKEFLHSTFTVQKDSKTMVFMTKDIAISMEAKTSE